ncbi:zinc knuckle-domain-containing protein [Suillus discolor]|uniref:Zinc knuckle-domain-containing protein n=1 Tax=Suillus discolor TaxID=1912936 RepID=A0A9P7F0C1_9AGAM|nr:zinc knuckle-domain-containing protein [Suillus discolor]KAG2101023.1 zinc knuckle-domain-containing protein [Suillus discolor]
MSKFAPHRRSNNNPRANSATVCQKCLGTGHFIFECKSTRPYVSRPSRTELLENPKLLAKLKAEGKPSVEVPEEFKTKSGTANRILESKEQERLALEESKGKSKEEDGRARKKARRSSRSSSDNSDSDSESDSDSGSSSESSASSTSSSDASRLISRDRGRKRPKRQDSSSIRSASSSRSRSRD